jgi:hypothetical protein
MYAKGPPEAFVPLVGDVHRGDEPRDRIGS